MEVIDELETLTGAYAEPDIEAALKRVLVAGQRRRDRRLRRVSLALLSMASGAVMFAIPGVRVAAQDLYAELAVRTIGVTPHFAAGLPLELLLPNVFPFGPVTASHEVSLAEAQAFVPFPIRLPHTTLLPYEAKLFAHAESSVSRRIDRAAVETALEQLGREPVELPAGLDQAVVSVKFQKSVSAKFGECPQIVGPWRSCAFLTQSLAPRLSFPREVNPEDLTVFSLRLLGMNSVDAKALAKTGVIFFPPEDYARHKVVDVNGQQGVLVVYEPAQTGEVAYDLSWTDHGIFYSLFGRNPGTAVSIAESLR